ncbi:hypothetical protein B0H14DRAFT_3853111 [Mycena olivaceomarginata]|nr:hypothetical protein B0H14DRAFT_3853111 [Mycena olivaceomarginata]
MASCDFLSAFNGSSLPDATLYGASEASSTVSHAFRPLNAPQHSICHALIPPLPAHLQRLLPVPGHPYTAPPTLRPLVLAHPAAHPAVAARTLHRCTCTLPLQTYPAAAHAPSPLLLAHPALLLLSAECVPRRRCMRSPLQLAPPVSLLLPHHTLLLLSAACVPRCLIAPRHCMRTLPQLEHPATARARVARLSRCCPSCTTPLPACPNHIPCHHSHPIDASASHAGTLIVPTSCWTAWAVPTSSDARDPVGMRVREMSNDNSVASTVLNIDEYTRFRHP